MVQIISIIDSYGYLSMVRQVAGERVFAPLRKRHPDEALILKGLEASHRVLGTLESIIPGDGPVAGGEVWSLADFHLAPMMVYFTTVPEGAEALARYRKLSVWWQVMRERESVLAVATGLPTERPGVCFDIWIVSKGCDSRGQQMIFGKVHNAPDSVGDQRVDVVELLQLRFRSKATAPYW